MLNERKVAQVAAHLLCLRGGKMSHLKLMKLMYLADRECYKLYGRSITGDRAVSMDNGPVLSQTLNLMDGEARYASNGWDTLISAKSNHELTLKRALERSDMDELSRAEVEILDSVYSTYGRMGRWELVDLTHQLPEWVNPDGSSLPIATQDILLGLGKKSNVIVGLMRQLDENRAVDAVLASL